MEALKAPSSDLDSYLTSLFLVLSKIVAVLSGVSSTLSSRVVGILELSKIGECESSKEQSKDDFY